MTHIFRYIYVYLNVNTKRRPIKKETKNVSNIRMKTKFRKKKTDRFDLPDSFLITE